MSAPAVKRATLVGMVALVVACGASGSTVQARPPGGAVPSGVGAALRVIPFPGTPDASASSRIIFSALRPSDVRSVSVTGSRSGAHRGRLVALPAGAGTAFVPRRPFTARESVHVSATLRSPESGRAEGEPGTRRLSFSFGVGAHLAIRSENVKEKPGARSGESHGPTQHFRSAPDLRPPVIAATSNPDTASGDIFLAPQNTPQVGPMIVGARGQLVWFHPLPNGSRIHYATNLEVQQYGGRPVLTWWQGQQLGAGEGVIMDRSYRRIAIVHAGDGYQADLHEFQITPQGTALLDVLTVTRADLRSVGGPPAGPLLDNVIQEVDIRTGQVLWEWHCLGHIPVSASYATYSPKDYWYDAFHLNSIQQLPNRNLLISVRNTWAVYEISRQTGRVIWTLGGRHSDFHLGPGARFQWQHDARLRRGGLLTVFDDGASDDGQAASQSSAEALQVDLAARTASLVRRFTHSPPLLTTAAGNAQTLPNGNLFVGWGEQPEFSEYTSSGRQIFTGSLPLGVGSYRALRFPWIGRPATRPAVALSRSAGGRLTVYASWNGATQVAQWRVRGGARPGALKPLIGTAPRGFETAIAVPGRPLYVAVQAVDGHGSVIGTSPVLKVRPA